MKKMLIIKMLFCCSILFSCGTKNNLPPEIFLASKKIEFTSGVFMKFPNKIVLKDSILYIQDGHALEYFVHAFRFPSMEYLYSLGKVGDGPNEYIALGGFTVDDDHIYLFETNKARLDIYDKTNLSSITSISYPRDVAPILSVADMHEKGYILIDYTGENRLIFVDKEGNILGKHFSIINDDAGVANLALGMQAILHTAFIDYNQKNRIAAVVSHLGELLEIYYIDRMEQKVVLGEGGTPVLYKTSRGKALGKIEGYFGVKVCDDKMYTIFSGITRKEQNNIEKEGKITPKGGDKILVYDLEGNMIQRYKLDRHIYGFWIDEENKRIYAVDNNEDDPLYYFDIPDEV